MNSYTLIWHKLNDQQGLTYTSSVLTLDAVKRADQERLTIEMDQERESQETQYYQYDMMMMMMKMMMMME